MFEKLDILRMAQGLATHAATRQTTIAQNVAQADTPGYKARDVAPFSETFQPSDAGALRQTRPGHLLAVTPEGRPPVIIQAAAGAVSPNGNSVSLESELVKSAEVRQQHELALSVYKSSLDIIRTSLGRR